VHEPAPGGGAVARDSSFALAPDGTRLFVESQPGPGALHGILSDGVLCDGFIWKYIWNDLAAALGLVHWHYRGHGRSASPADPDRIDIRALAVDLDTVRRHAGDPPCVLFGHSMGCQVALEAYRLRPDGVRALVLLCGSSGNVTSTFHGMPLLDLVLPSLLAMAKTTPDVMRALWTRVPKRLALAIALRSGEIDAAHVRAEDFLPYLSHMTHVDFPMFLKMLRAAGEHTARDLLPRIEVPVLVVAGERDTFTPPYLARQMADAIPRGEFVMVPSGTHVAPIEQPALVNAAIVKFLRSAVAVQAGISPAG
jgi:pimeloyl-ACP methyl ester carboxylesterase